MESADLRVLTTQTYERAAAAIYEVRGKWANAATADYAGEFSGVMEG